MINITDLIGALSLVFLFGVIVGILILYFSTKRKIKSKDIQDNPTWCSSKDYCEYNCCSHFPDECAYDSRKPHKKENNGKP